MYAIYICKIDTSYFFQHAYIHTSAYKIVYQWFIPFLFRINICSQLLLGLPPPLKHYRHFLGWNPNKRKKTVLNWEKLEKNRASSRFHSFLRIPSLSL